MSGPKIVAALAGAGLLLTVAFQYGVAAILGEPMRQAAGNAEALGAVARSAPPQPGAERDRPRPRAEGGRPPRTVGGHPAGWQVDDSWGQSSPQSTSRKAGP